MKVFVTGASSFLGRELRRQCAGRRIETGGVDLVPGGEPGVLQGDIRDARLERLLPEGLDAVVHLAAVARDSDCRKDPLGCFDVNVIGTLNVYEAARRRGARQLVFASSEWVYDKSDSRVPRSEEDPIDPLALTSEYALSKLVGEAVLRQAQQRGGLAVTVLRFGILYGPRREGWSAVESLLARVAAGEPVEIGSGQTARGFLHVTDAARAIVAALGRRGFDTFNIQPERPVPLSEVVEQAASVLGRTPRLLERDPKRPSIRNVSGARARRELGFAPAISLEEGLRDVARAMGWLSTPAQAKTGPREIGP